MIRHVMVIKEVPGRGFSIDMEPNQEAATETEMLVAGCFDLAIKTTAEYLMRRAAAAEMVEGTEIKEIVEQKLRQFESIQ
jgi:hypothetical protein